VTRSGKGIDLSQVLGTRYPFPEQLEVAIPGGVGPDDIIGAFQMRSGKVVGDLIPNSNFKP
jgi:hypothetical protein